MKHYHRETPRCKHDLFYSDPICVECIWENAGSGKQGIAAMKKLITVCESICPKEKLDALRKAYSGGNYYALQFVKRLREAERNGGK